MVEVDELLNKPDEFSSVIDEDGRFLLYSTNELDEVGACTEGIRLEVLEKLRPGEVLFVFRKEEAFTGVKTPLLLEPPFLSCLLPDVLEKALEDAIREAKERIEELIDVIELPDLTLPEGDALVLRNFREEVFEIEDTVVFYAGRIKGGFVRATFAITKEPKGLARKLDKMGIRSVNLHRLSETFRRMLEKGKLNVYHLVEFSLSEKVKES